tara:strand:- start:1088 stop:1294 length:207 start_codon:yes stop_codon:yes gene_type:complete
MGIAMLLNDASLIGVVFFFENAQFWILFVGQIVHLNLEFVRTLLMCLHHVLVVQGSIFDVLYFGQGLE